MCEVLQTKTVGQSNHSTSIETEIAGSFDLYLKEGERFFSKKKNKIKLPSIGENRCP